MNIKSFSGHLFQLTAFHGFYCHHDDGRTNEDDYTSFNADDFFICICPFTLNEDAHFDVYFTRAGFIRISRFTKFRIGDDFIQIL